MDDAPDWTNVSSVTPPVVIANTVFGRYMQYRVEMTPNAAGDETPTLNDVTFDWLGEKRMVEMSGTFTLADDYGMLDVKVDDTPLKRGVIMVELELYKDVRGHGKTGLTRVTSEARLEMTPRNTGR